MATNTFRLVFDLASTPDRWGGVMTPLFILTAIGFILVITPQKILDRLYTHGPKKMAGKLFGIFFFLFVGSITTSVTYGHFARVETYKSLEDSGKLSFAEGCLQGFHPMRASGHENEVVKVAGEEFSYSDFDESSPAFNNTESHGGPIHADSAVKIWHHGNSIIKLEVRDHACPRAPDLPQSN